MTTEETISPVLYETYGTGGYTRSFAAHLAERIDGWPNDDDDSRYLDREYMIMRTCWDWFSGGTTAESTAKKIEAALAEAEANASNRSQTQEEGK